MKYTCCFLNCPFISICNKYSLTADQGKQCKTQEFIIKRALALSKKKKQGG